MISNLFQNTKSNNRAQLSSLQAELEALRAQAGKSNGIFELNPEGEISFANEKIISALGYESNEILGLHHTKLIKQVDTENYWEGLISGVPQTGEFSLIAKNGALISCNLRATPLLDSKSRNLDKVMGFISFGDQKSDSSHVTSQSNFILSEICYAELSPEGLFQSISSSALTLLECDLEYLLNQPLFTFTKDQTSDTSFTNEINESLLSGEKVTLDVCRVAPTGSELWLKETYVPILDDQKNLIKTVVYFLDITKEKAASNLTEEKLRAIERSQAMIVFDTAGIILDINENFTKVMGYSREEIIGKHHSTLVSTAYKSSENYKQFWENLRIGKFDSGDYPRINKSGKEVWLQASYNPIVGLDGKVSQIVKYAIDVTDRVLMAAENSKRSLEATMIKNALESSSNNLMVADQNGIITYMNPATSKLMHEAAPILKKVFPHFDADKLIGQNFDVFHKNPSHQRNLLASLKGQHVSEIPVGSLFFRLTANPISDENGLRLGSVVEWVDLSQEKLIQTQIQEALSSAVSGDISFVLDKARAKGSSVDVMDGINKLLEIMNEVIQKVQLAVETIGTAAKQISAGNNDLSRRTEAQASNLQETASSMEQLAATVKQNADNAKLAYQMVEDASDVALRGGEMVESVVSTMTSINESAQKIEDIISVIDGIAFQTNILALNAAVEAARAGEQGRGFAVVAGEVRNLAQRSATAAKEIKQLISDSVSKTADGAALVDSTGQTMREIVLSVQKVKDIMSDITDASIDQSNGIAQVNKAVTHMDDVTQQNAALVEEAAAASESLVDQSNRLMDTINKFKLRANAELPANVRILKKDKLV